MARRRHKPEEIAAKLQQVEVLTAQGKSVAEAIRSIGMTEITYYRRQNVYKLVWDDAGFGSAAAAQFCT